jgi:multiple sugar transport system permease protein
MFTYLYNYQEGPINQLLRKIGLEGVQWLGASYFVNFSLAFVVLWRYLGFDMVVVLGALQSINPSLYESASIDGANFWHNICYITIPSIKPVIVLLLFLGLNGSLQVFFEPYVITQGGPMGLSHTFSTMAYNYAFQFQNMGKAAALGVILTTFVIIILAIQTIVTIKRRKGDVTDE